ncbi:NAD(P)/FAD-dependent oxidoreductase [Marnyiella aurantia]|uniref:NAD(P)/FAD-dependent oxidoreductase n=1 Tax=Marnyiella aurantia TaxID=2758037 RepID=A0A7D7LP48_9FLAO|nr:NAD(P)/FAD-dependent oxidoreductase [Marnyiella aurantia]MBA5247177.1 NAD(P)/FAD-dependent oxidoreductase [Marnyiella aurantia]QMS97494.1 NAD(P)/FAD-dependent oxidoreductase [Marnyiella aurantia]
MDKKSVIIIGGGAAGFFCVANLDERKFQVKILEQNSDVLQKVKISGGGRCNVTHACFDPKELVGYYPRGNKELISVFHKFQPGDTMDWFEQRGVALKVEADNRIFPKSNSSQSIIDALLQTVNKKGFEILTKTVVQNIQQNEHGYEVSTTNGSFSADYIIYAPGSAPKSLKMIQQLGHKLVPAVPSLFTFNIKNELLKDLMGTSFPNAGIAIPSLKADESGPLLITHWGLSGPAVLKISAWKARELADCGYKTEIVVNFLGMDTEDAANILQTYRKENPKKTVGASKIFDVTTRFWHRVLWLSKVDLDKNISNLSSKDMESITGNLCANRMQVTGKSTYKDEFVTAGGVELKEINFKNMSSRILPDFYLAGEVLNIDGVTGGFNFQACWSEAWLIAQDLNSK